VTLLDTGRVSRWESTLTIIVFAPHGKFQWRGAAEKSKDRVDNDSTIFDSEIPR
jgi:hypothetical protein